MIAHCSVRIMAKFLLIMLILLAPLSAFASVINGKVEDLFGHPIEGVDIYIDNSRFAAKTNHMGEYNLPFVPGKLSVNIKKGGYTTETYSLDLYTDSDFPAKTVTLLQIPGNGIYLVDYDKSRYLWLPSDDCEVVHEEQRSPGLVLPRPVYYVRDLGDSTSIRPGEASFLIIPPEGEDKNINVGLYRIMSSSKIYTGYAIGEGSFKGGQIATGLVGEQEHRSFGSEQLKVTTVNLVSGNYVFVRTSHDMMYDSLHPFTYDSKGGCAGLIVTRYAGASDDIDERSVWHPSEGLWEEVHSGCAQSGEYLTDVECIGGEMSRLGASEEAIAFVIKMGGEAYLSHFDEHGIVDNGVVTYPVLNDPSVSEPVFITPNGHIIDDIYSLAKEIDIREIDGYKQVVAKYPKVEIWPMSFFQSSVSLPHGGQQFVYAFTLLDGCRACAVAGHAEIAFNFTSRGVLENVSPLGLKFVAVAAGPAAPSNLTALATSNTQINLDWRDTNTNETGYYVERRVGTGVWSRIATLGANAAAYVSGGLTGSTTYSYRVQAYQAQGVTSAYSNEASATTPAGGLPQPRLNDTGIDGCADGSRNNLPCPVTGYPEQDAQFGRDKTANSDSDGHAGFSFTKLDANGNALAASATAWSCVRDNVTGRVWEVKTDDGRLRDKDWTYTWYNPNAATNGGSAGTPNGGACSGSACDTSAYVQAVNATGLCGARDWRMPTVSELLSIVSNDRVGPAMDTAFFRIMPSGFPFWWSSSPYAGDSGGAWDVSFDDGGVGYGGKSGTGYVRLVRGGQ